MTLSPYWQSVDGRAVIYNCTALELLATLPDASIDYVLTDPPYSKKTHKGARKNVKKKGGGELLDFKHITPESLRTAMDEIGRVMKRWFTATMDYNHAFMFEQTPPKHMRVARLGVWVKTNPTPQISGDRPAQGWEAIVFAHREKRKMVWSGGGRSGVFLHSVERKAQYASQKPLSLIREFVELFSDPGDTVLDCFMGGGTSLVAAYERGRIVIGCDPSLKSCEVTAGRLRDIEKRGESLPATTSHLKRSRAVQTPLFGGDS